jgi:2-polyprenyl-3-methyl-5-hydroxy-6-metoxy-1,4-benzoquinol methylase
MFKLQPKLKDGIISFDLKDKTTKSVTQFYEIEPFPNYSSDENKRSLLDKGDSNYLSKKLKEFIGFNKSFIEIGSGTSQLSNYLATGTNNKIYAFDPTEPALRLGYNFASENNINNVTFINADIFDDVLEDEIFDFVWCSGVLHHTKDPFLGFKIIQKSLKPNGYILIGLYNKYGRFRTFVRQILYKIFGRKLIMFMDPYLRSLNKKTSQRKINSWIRDQYEHPVEQSHTFDEVLKWFDDYGIEFINSIPSIGGDENNLYFKQNSSGRGNAISRIFSQIKMIFGRLGGEGGLFIMIGRKTKKN